jgi:hypothetical protein
MDIKNLNSKIEELSEEVHNAWMKEKLSQGFHAPFNCPRFPLIPHDEDEKFVKKCEKCHTDLYPYSELPENIKEYDRVTVRAVLHAIEKVSE